MSSTYCPFCKQLNQCEVNSKACWCLNKNIPASLIALLPSNTINKDCICANCVDAYKSNATAFKANLNGKAQ